MKPIRLLVVLTLLTSLDAAALPATAAAYRLPAIRCRFTRYGGSRSAVVVDATGREVLFVVTSAMHTSIAIRSRPVHDVPLHGGGADMIAAIGWTWCASF